MRNLLATIGLVLLSTPAWAVDTATTYNSGILVLLFVGFCSLIIIMQLVPAVLILIGAAKAVTPQKEAIKG